jgi:outer membrane protein assembly factor BamD (BamD/ComL family)
MRFSVVMVCVAAFLVLTSCSDRKAQEIFETAQFEELQKNIPHALQLYSDLVEKYPKSEAAARARERLEELKKKN